MVLLVGPFSLTQDIIKRILNSSSTLFSAKISLLIGKISYSFSDSCDNILQNRSDQSEVPSHYLIIPYIVFICEQFKHVIKENPSSSRAYVDPYRIGKFIKIHQDPLKIPRYNVVYKNDCKEIQMRLYCRYSLSTI